MIETRTALIIAAFVFLLSVPSCFAGGSVELSDIEPLLKQQPKLWQFFMDHLDISTHGGGARLGSVGIPLRGYRVGPYEFPAKWKGAAGEYDTTITIVTDTYFLDAKGKETTNEKKAVKVEEMLTGITVGPLRTPARDGTFVQSAE